MAMSELNSTHTLPQMLREQAQHNASGIAIRQKEHGIWKPLNWASYFERATHVGLGFKAVGLSDGAHVGVLSENRIEWVLSQLGAGLVGGVTVGVYPTSPTNEIAYVLSHADAEVVVCEDQEQTDKVLQALDQLPRLKKIVVMEKKGFTETHAQAGDMVISFDALEKLGAQSAHSDVVEQVFRPFYTQKKDGLGLGLSVSKSLVENNGGVLRYLDHPTKCFEIILPSERIQL